MAHSTITLIIIAATCVLYIIDKLPLDRITQFLIVPPTKWF